MKGDATGDTGDLGNWGDVGETGQGSAEGQSATLCPLDFGVLSFEW